MQPVAGDPLRQWINRLNQSDRFRIANRRNMIGMDDLQFIAIAFKLARNDARFADGQLLLRPASGATKEGQGQVIAFTIDAVDAQRAACTATRTVARNCQSHYDVLPDISHIDDFDGFAIGPACREMIKQVLHPLQPEPIQWPGNTRTDAFKRFHFGK